MDSREPGMQPDPEPTSLEGYTILNPVVFDADFFGLSTMDLRAVLQPVADNTVQSGDVDPKEGVTVLAGNGYSQSTNPNPEILTGMNPETETSSQPPQVSTMESVNADWEELSVLESLQAQELAPH